MKPSGLRLVAAVLPFVIGVVAAVVLFVALPGVSVRFTSSPGLMALGVGAALSVIVVVWTVSSQRARRKREELLKSGAAQARAEHQAFLARLDHEMKNPLTAIRAALATHGTKDSPHLQVADSQVARLGSLVGDLRKLSDLQSRPLEKEPVDLGETVSEAVQAVQTYLQQMGSKRHFAVHFPTVPWRIPPVLGDGDLLYLAVFNLLANAAKFTRDGDSVEVRAGETDGRVWLEVADTGLGIPDADLPHVWDELARATNARGIAGTGLGLPLVRVVVERHGGKVGLRSRENEGTAVRIELPVGRPVAKAQAAPVQQTPPPAAQPSHPPQVLAPVVQAQSSVPVTQPQPQPPAQAAPHPYPYPVPQPPMPVVSQPSAVPHA
jgi:two-component system, OmpR family, sensor kinase